MRTACILLALCLLGTPIATKAQSSEQVAQTRLVIGRETYFDFGPPFHYLELIQLQDEESGASVKRVLLTPEAACFQLATAEFKTSLMHESIEQLFAGVDPCGISAKQIKKELNRRKKALVFSGMNVSMQVQCKEGPRILSSAVLDRDIFASKPQTPRVTSWTMEILQKLDNLLGPGAMDKPMFQMGSTRTDESEASSPEFVRALKSGAYDGLFPGSADHPSAIYKASRKTPPAVGAVLTKISPSNPDAFIAPTYPPIAKAARVEGDISFRLKVGAACAPEQVEITAGPKLLHQSTADAVKRWRFCNLAAGQVVQGTIEFRLNCKQTVNSSVSQK